MILVTVLLSAVVNAGQETHGGDYILCPNRKTVVLDYFQAQLPTFTGDAQLVDISQMNADQVIQYFSNKFSETLLGFEFKKYVKTVGDYKRWIVVEQLVEQSDENLPFVPKDCEVKQGAVRQNGVVYISRDAMTQLSPDQIGVLAIHEALSEYLMKLKAPVFSSAHVRGVITELLKQETNHTSVAQIFEMYDRSSSLFCKGGFYGSSSQPVHGGPLVYEGFGFYFPQTTNPVSGLFETNSGQQVDLFALQQKAGFKFLHVFPLLDASNPKSLSGKLSIKINDKEYFFGKDMYCVAKNNECIAGSENAGADDIAAKYGKLHIVMSLPIKMYFDKDPEKRVFAEVETYYNGYPLELPCPYLGGMQRQSNGQLSR